MTGKITRMYSEQYMTFQLLQVRVMRKYHQLKLRTRFERRAKRDGLPRSRILDMAMHAMVIKPIGQVPEVDVSRKTSHFVISFLGLAGMKRGTISS